MKKNPFDYLVEFYKEKTDRNRKVVEYIHTQSDSLITWLIGFSFTGMLLMVSSLEKIKERKLAKATLICLFICIILGLIFRYVSYLMTMFQKSLDDYFHGLFSEKMMTPIYLEEDISAMDFDGIIALLKEDFDEVIPYNYELTEELKALELPRLKQHYLHLIEHSKKIFDFGITHIAEIDETAYKIKKDKSIDQVKRAFTDEGFRSAKIGYNYPRWVKIRGWLYTIAIISFIVAVTLLFVGLMIYL
jgi:hypothetical protein